MDELKVSYDAISENNNLSAELKDCFKELVTIFNKTFSGVSLSNFNERIKGLEIKRGNKYITKEACEYNPKENVLYLNEQLLKKADAKHELMFALLTIISADENFYGFGNDEKLTVFNVGVTEMITNLLVGNDGEEDE